MPKCGAACEVYSRVCGYHRPVSSWNVGKREEFCERKNYKANGRMEPNRHGGTVRPPVLAVVERSTPCAEAAD